MEKIVIACDSFKGSLSSPEIALYAETAIREVYPECKVVKLPVADGGEGTAEALVAALQGQWVACRTHDPLNREIGGRYGLSGSGKTAIIEMAAASGLTLLRPEERNPMITTTYGTGELIRDALEKGCRDFLIGIGGSATNDGGTGMLQALGYRFLDREGKDLPGCGESLVHICSIDKAQVLPALQEARFTIACDVNNPFYGPQGAAQVYARQKGADDRMIEELDRGMKSFAALIRKTEKKEIATLPGAGAAGGSGGAFVAILNGTLKPGIDMVLEAIDFKRHLRNAGLVITGEGSLDAQTGMGKAPAGILRMASARNIPVIAIGGQVEEYEQLNRQGFLAVLSIQPRPVSLGKALEPAFAGENIRRTLIQYLRTIKYFRPSPS